MLNILGTKIYFEIKINYYYILYFYIYIFQCKKLILTKKMFFIFLYFCLLNLYAIFLILIIKVMELETQVQVSGNQLRRQDEDNKAVREQLELAETKQRDLVVKLREQQNKYTDLESKVFKHNFRS